MSKLQLVEILDLQPVTQVNLGTFLAVNVNLKTFKFEKGQYIDWNTELMDLFPTFIIKSVKNTIIEAEGKITGIGNRILYLDVENLKWSGDLKKLSTSLYTVKNIVWFVKL